MEAEDDRIDHIESTEVEVKGSSEFSGRRMPSFTRYYKEKPREPQDYSVLQTLLFAYQSLGVVYGDLGTSPLYVFSSINLSNPEEKDILGILSLIFWTLTLIALVKYVFIVLQADDHGEGGTFALYSLICQHVNLQTRITKQNARLESDTNLRFFSQRSTLQSRTKQFLEKSPRAQALVIFIVLFGTCMLIGDGALTPAISVLSAVQGIQKRSSKIDQMDVVLISIAILLVLFLFQSYGSSRVGFAFSPIMILWFGCTSSIGVYNIIKFYPAIFKALSPHYIFVFFDRNHKHGWEVLGAVFLCMTGGEAMFADLGHFTKKSIQIAFSAFIYPALILTYGGQAAYLVKHPESLRSSFYSSIPDPVFWPMFVIATLAAIVASQSLISASFSITRQSMALGCFPRVTMLHTSKSHEGQVYSPEVNYFLMVACILIVAGFKGGPEIGNAYGVAVVWVMLITTCLMTVVMLTIWHTNAFLVAVFFMVFFSLEGTYMTSLLNKVPQGGWVPFAISVFFLIIMLSWTYGRSKKHEYESKRKMTPADLSQLISEVQACYVPGVCLFFTDLVNGIPPIVRHYVKNVGALRRITVIITIRTLPIRTVLPDERYFVGKLGPDGMYRCLVQYGYTDVPGMEDDKFIASVMEKIKEQIDSNDELTKLESAKVHDVVFVMGRTILRSSKQNGCIDRIIINYVYRFLQKNFRSTVSMLGIHPEKLLQVGILYEI
ncbi:potassium transporter 26-like [Nymphaea colorata]|nr:potassium transporter 26-like [Nymphaea colorata]